MRAPMLTAPLPVRALQVPIAHRATEEALAHLRVAPRRRPWSLSRPSSTESEKS